ncbi:hypothetical protein HF086_013304 [Spodoptera exigua]|uniref:Metalloendopeptidase n=1 Tax=Spodoptera exigua TaxID=7107 RepID=A0A922MR62_SPOEX|nr:hypothetical protein HF086_013304 [Spodoptera exigua]
MNNFLYFFVILISSINALPAGDYNFFNYLYDDFGENSIDGVETIDVSSLGPEAYGLPRNESGDALSQWSESSLMNPEEVGDYAEGDILMPPQQGRNGVRNEVLRWPKGHIPYVIEGYFNSEQRETIMRAIADYHRLTCLRFVPYNGQKDYITIQSKNTGCWSSVGRVGTVLHELLHAIGFMHEQSRPERDDFISVRYNNIKPGAENNFRKSTVKQTNDFNVPYDYNSVMHYSEYAFSKNQQKTIEPKVGGVKLGQREGLSRGDVRKINNMYNCKKE